jgi:hypothetical protein
MRRSQVGPWARPCRRTTSRVTTSSRSRQRYCNMDRSVFPKVECRVDYHECSPDGFKPRIPVFVKLRHQGTVKFRKGNLSSFSSFLNLTNEGQGFRGDIAREGLQNDPLSMRRFSFDIVLSSPWCQKFLSNWQERKTRWQVPGCGKFPAIRETNAVSSHITSTCGETRRLD